MAGLFVPTDGRCTSQNVLSGPLFGGEAQFIVSSGTSAAATAANGNTYQVSLAVLAAFFAAFPALNRESITAGATSINPYNVLTTDTQILFNKTIGAASFAVLPLASSMVYPFPILFKDLKGDAASNNITITFTGGQLCDGLSSVVISTAYGWASINPAPGGTGWFLTS